MNKTYFLIFSGAIMLGLIIIIGMLFREPLPVSALSPGHVVSGALNPPVNLPAEFLESLPPAEAFIMSSGEASKGLPNEELKEAPKDVPQTQEAASLAGFESAPELVVAEDPASVGMGGSSQTFQAEAPDQANDSPKASGISTSSPNDKNTNVVEPPKNSTSTIEATASSSDTAESTLMTETSVVLKQPLPSNTVVIEVPAPGGVVDLPGLVPVPSLETGKTPVQSAASLEVPVPASDAAIGQQSEKASKNDVANQKNSDKTEAKPSEDTKATESIKIQEKAKPATPEKVQEKPEERPKAKELVTQGKMNPQGNTITLATLIMDGDKVTLRLEANAPISAKSFLLTKPDRVVLDLAGRWRVQMPVVHSNRMVKSARVGEQTTGQRIVFDMLVSPKDSKVVQVSPRVVELQIR